MTAAKPSTNLTRTNALGWALWHHAEAERLLDDDETRKDIEAAMRDSSAAVAHAQVHATLAVAAATLWAAQGGR